MAFCAMSINVAAQTSAPATHSSALLEVRLGFGLSKPPYIIGDGKEGLEPESENCGVTDWAAYVRLNRGDPGTPTLLDDEETPMEEEEIEE